MKNLLWTLWLLVFCGCPSYSTFGTARVLERGRFQPYAAPQAAGAVSSAGSTVFPQFELGARYGLAEGWDAGARIWYAGLALEGRRQLRLSTGKWSPDIALLGQLAYAAPNTGAVQLALLLGFPMTGELQWVLGPKASYELWFRPNPAGRPLQALHLGSSLGLAWELHPRFTLLPEVTMMFPAAVEAGLSTPAGRGVFLQAGMGVLF